MKKNLEKEMREKAKAQNYEAAAMIRDKIQAIENISQKQKVSNISENSIDVIGIAKNDISVCIEVFFVRGSKMIGREHFFLDNIKDMEIKEILSGFIKEYYMGNENLPSKIMIEEEIDDEEILSGILSNRARKESRNKISEKRRKAKIYRNG